MKRISNGPHSIDELVDIHCEAIVYDCLKELEEKRLVQHVTKMHVVNPSPDDPDSQECDQWVITLYGLDYLAEKKELLVWKIISPAISFIALLISILSYLNTLGSK